MRIIAVSNQKGGVAKTTTVASLAVGLAKRGKRVLAVDLDSQRNLSMCCDVDMKNVPTVYHLLKKTEDEDGEELTFDDVVQRSPKGFDVLPASRALSAADTQITDMGKEFRLRDILDPVRDRYDFILIDTPPQLGVLNLMADTAATDIIIPTTASMFDFEGIIQIYNTIASTRKYKFNENLRVMGVLLTKHNPRANLSKQMKEYLEAKICPMLETTVFNTFIRQTLAVGEAQTNRTDIISYAPHATAAQDYMALVDEVIERSK